MSSIVFFLVSPFLHSTYADYGGDEAGEQNGGGERVVADIDRVG